MARNDEPLEKITTRLYKRDLTTLREMCTTQGLEFNFLLRKAVHTFCQIARADAAKEIDKLPAAKPEVRESLNA